MRGELVAKLALGVTGLCALGGVAGMGLANYATSGAFDFYRQERVAQWQPEPPAQPTALESTDLAFASDRPDTDVARATEGELASFNP